MSINSPDQDVITWKSFFFGLTGPIGRTIGMSAILSSSLVSLPRSDTRPNKLEMPPTKISFSPLFFFVNSLPTQRLLDSAINSQWMDQ